MALAKGRVADLVGIGVSVAASADMIAGCFDALATAGIRYAVLHGVDTIPHAVESDIDVIVPARDMPHLTRVLGSFARQQGGFLCQVIRHELTARYHVLALPGVGPSPQYVKIDASCDYRSHGRLFLSTSEAFVSARCVNGITSVARSTEFVCYLVKRVLKGSIGPARLQHLRELWASEPETCAAHARRLMSNSAVDDLRRMMESSDDVEASLLAMRGTILRGSLARRPFSPAVMAIREVPRVIDRLARRTGFQVAVLGPDGVGKSSLLSSLERDLAPAFRSVQQIHLRPGVLGASRRTKGGASVPYQIAPYSVTMSVAKLAYLVSDFALGYWLRLWPRLVASTLILCDRYYLDVVADPKRYRYAGPSPLPRALSRVVPGPDVCIVLTASVDAIQGRKAEVSADETAAQLDRYSSLGDDRHVLVIDASGDEEQVANTTAWAVLQRMSQRRVVIR